MARRGVCSRLPAMPELASRLNPPDRQRLRNGEVVTVRPIRPDDEAAMVRFHQALSEDSIFNRYAGTLKLDARVAHSRLARVCLADPAREQVLVAERSGDIVAV